MAEGGFRSEWESAVEEQFSAASGPGGQNVNKVATSVRLWFDPVEAGLAADVVSRLKRLAGSRWGEDGRLRIEASEHRTREANRQAARRRLAGLVEQARHSPRRRRATRPTRASKERRLEHKKKRGEIKRLRGRPE